MGLTVATAPSVEPVTLAEAKAYARVDIDDDDSIITALIAAATDYAEDYTARAFVTTAYTWTMDALPSVLRPPRSPLQSVTSIAYLDTDGDSQTLDSSFYTVDTGNEPGRIVEANGYDYPSTYDEINAVTVTFVAGYGDEASDVPDGIKTAIKMLVSHWYEFREPVITGTIVTKVPDTVHALLWQHKIAEAT